MRAWLGWFIIIAACALTLIAVWRLTHVGDDPNFGVRLELPENITEAEMAEIEADMKNGAITLVQGSIVVVIGSMIVAHLWRRRRSKK